MSTVGSNGRSGIINNIRIYLLVYYYLSIKSLNLILHKQAGTFSLFYPLGTMNILRKFHINTPICFENTFSWTMSSVSGTRVKGSSDLVGHILWGQQKFISKSVWNLFTPQSRMLKQLFWLWQSMESSCFESHDWGGSSSCIPNNTAIIFEYCLWN